MREKEKQPQKSGEDQKIKKIKRKEEVKVCSHSIQVYKGNAGWDREGINIKLKRGRHLWEKRSDERDDGRIREDRESAEPEIPMDTKKPPWKEKAEIVKKAIAASALGPNGLLYKVKQKRPKILK